MSPLDWIFIIIVILLGLRCLARGFVAELMSFASWAIGLGLGLVLYKQAARLLIETYPKVPLPEAVSFIALFLIGFLLTRIIAQALGEGLEAANLEAIDKILGLVFGVFEGLVLVSLLLLLLDVMKPLVDTSGLLASSRFAQILLPIIKPTIQKVLPAALNSIPKSQGAAGASHSPAATGAGK